ncbi:MAG TPA: hypothetical protein DDX98_02680 [Bacteroidales bacterium]|nr:hypothetical protein [Bacteroidales bacterium]
MFMMKVFIFLLLTIFTFLNSFSQDIIIRKDGTKIRGKITNEDSTSVYFKTTINRNVVNTSLKKVDVDSIINRERIVFTSKNILKTDALSYIISHPSFMYERVLNNNISAFFVFGLGKESSESGEDAKDSWMSEFGGYSVRFQIGDFKHSEKINNFYRFGARYYLDISGTDIPEGVHLGASLGFYRTEKSFSILDTSERERNSYTINEKLNMLSFDVGYQSVAFKVIALELVLSPGYIFGTKTEAYFHIDNNNNIYRSSKTIDGNGFVLSVSLNVGIAFG